MRILCRAIAFAAVGIFLICAPPARAQDSDPVVAHYQAYVAAFRAGDIATAETEARAALAASEADGADHSHTAILALNLALIEMRLGEFAAAQQPAQRAAELAQSQGQASGVDLLAAQLAVARVQLATAPSDASAQAMVQLLGQTHDQSGAIDAHAFVAAMELARWAFSERQYNIVQNATAYAAEHARGVNGPPAFEQAHRLMAEGAGFLFINQPAQALTRFDQAMALLREFGVETIGPDMNEGQRAYADALLWRATAASAASTNPRAAPAASTPIRLTAPPDLAPLCPFRVAPAAPITFPSATRRNAQAALSGAVIMRFRISEQGTVESAEVVASSGAEFSRAVQAVPSWRVVQSAAPADCRMQTDMYLLPISFVMQ